LFDADALTLSRMEAEQFVATLNDHFSDSAYTFHSIHPERWYARLPAAIDVETVALPDVAGKSINERLPGGPNGAKLRKLMNEIQMLLHTHPVNQARELQGLPTVNSIWLWGSGRLPTLDAKPYAYLWASNPVAQGLAVASHTPWSELPANGRALFNMAVGSGAHLVVLDGLRGAAAQGDHDAWQKGLRVLEEKWFKPVTQAYRKGQLDALTIHALGPRHNMTFTLEGKARWKFWRRPRPLKHYATAA
jgi:hypothetical protein